MRIKFTKLITITLFSIVLIVSVACKQKNVKKIMADNQFAISLFRDTIFMSELFSQLDSTTTNWLRVDADGNLSAFYHDTLLGIVNASDFMSNVPDIDFNESASFNIPSIPPVPMSQVVQDSIDYEVAVPFAYEEYAITEVVLREGVLSLGLSFTPQLSVVKRVVLKSNSITLASGEKIKLEFDPNGNATVNQVDLANCKIVPNENQQIMFVGKIYIEYNLQDGLAGGDYQCNITGGITNIKFKTLTGVTNLDPVVFNDKTIIDFGVSGLTGHVFLPTPDIQLSYVNTFGCDASCDVNLLNFYSSINSTTVNLLGANDSIDIYLQPTQGEFYDEAITGFTDEIDALGQYTELNFGGNVKLNSSGVVSVSDTSKIDLAIGVDLPLQFNISNLEYRDTIPFSASGDGNNIQNYLDQIDFFIDFVNQLPLSVTIEAELLNTLDPTFHGYLFKTGVTPNNTIPVGQSSTLECSVTDDGTGSDLISLAEVLSADQIVLHFTVSTNGMQTLKMENYIHVGVRILTHTNEINMDDVL